MAMALSAGIAIAFLIAHAHYPPFRVFFAMASALFWLLFAGAAFLQSNNLDFSDIDSFFFLAGVGLTLAVPIIALTFNPSRQLQDEKRDEEEGKEVPQSFIEKMRAKQGLKSLNK